MNVWALNYRAHAQFVEPARSKSQLWRFVLGLILVAAIFVALSRAFLDGFFRLIGSGGYDLVVGADGIGQTASGMIALLVQLGLLTVAAGLVCIMVHARGPVTLIGPPRTARKQFLAVSVAMLTLLAALMVLPPYGYDEPLKLNMNVGRWIALLPLSLVAVLIQVSAEEVFFRGYMQQQLAARFRSPFVWLFVPALFFGIGHYWPGSGSNAQVIAIWATVFGLLMADLTARAGTLGPAIAVHFFNNASAMVLVSTPDHMSGLALFVLPFGVADEARMAAWLPVDFGLMLVSWLVARLAIRA